MIRILGGGILLASVGFATLFGPFGKEESTIAKSVTDLQFLITSLENQIENQGAEKDLAFSGNLFFAHSALISYFPVHVLVSYADGLIDAGVTRIDINPSADTWTRNDIETITKYDQLINYIDGRGIEVVLNPQYSATEGGVENFDVWKEETITAYKQIASRYKPDIFIVAHEPTTMAKRMGLRVSVGDWTNFVREAAVAVREASAATRVGAGGLEHEERYLNRWSRLPELDLVTINIYDLGKLKEYNKIIQTAYNNNKGVYIEETWRFPLNIRGAQNLEQASALGIGDVQYQEIDALWLRAVALYAKAWGLEAVTPFWTQTFFAYGDNGSNVSALDPEYNRNVMNAILRGERTKTFTAYKQVVDELE